MEDHLEQSVQFLFFRPYLLVEHDENKIKITNPAKAKAVILFILVKTDDIIFII
jgi:hypothetical protein